MSSKKKEINSKLYGILIVIVAIVAFIVLLSVQNSNNSDKSYSSGERDYIAPVEIKAGFIPMTPLDLESGDLSRQQNS